MSGVDKIRDSGTQKSLLTTVGIEQANVEVSKVTRRDGSLAFLDLRLGRRWKDSRTGEIKATTWVRPTIEGVEAAIRALATAHVIAQVEVLKDQGVAVVDAEKRVKAAMPSWMRDLATSPELH